MGLLDFLSGTVKAGMDKMNDMYIEKIYESYKKFRYDSNYELEELINNVDQSSLKIAIIFAISERDLNTGIRIAKNFDISKTTFAKFISHPEMKNIAREIITNWGN